MKTITHAISGLASSLLLNAGFANVAQKLDPISSEGKHAAVAPNGGTSFCAPCQFTPKAKR